jgi:hypothetical protein
MESGWNKKAGRGRHYHGRKMRDRGAPLRILIQTLASLAETSTPNFAPFRIRTIPLCILQSHTADAGCYGSAGLRHKATRNLPACSASPSDLDLDQVRLRAGGLPSTTVTRGHHGGDGHEMGAGCRRVRHCAAQDWLSTLSTMRGGQ